MNPIVGKVRFSVKEKLCKHLRRCRNAGVRVRYLIIINLLNDRSAYQTAEVLDVHNTTVYRVARRFRAAGRTRHGALQGDDMLAGIDADVAALQQVFTDETLVNPRRNPCVGHHFAGLAQAILGFIRHDLRTLDDRVFRFLRTVFGFLRH
jgi:hypothetical protein